MASKEYHDICLLYGALSGNITVHVPLKKLALFDALPLFLLLHDLVTLLLYKFLLSL